MTAQYSTRSWDCICHDGQNDTNKKPQNHAGRNAAHKSWNTEMKMMSQMLMERTLIHLSYLQSSTHLVNFSTGAVAPRTIDDNMCKGLLSCATMSPNIPWIRCCPQEEPAILRSGIKHIPDKQQKVIVRHKDVTIDVEVMYRILLAVNATIRCLSSEFRPLGMLLCHWA